ncbi:MAG TPA: hypothetical protein ENH25_00230 [candidate division Zixibacteria bacterium]|nr:hypothetical protein [candidate division Zixibacteria bacterium]
MLTFLSRLFGKTTVKTHGLAQFQAQRAKVEILEMEDVLFHLNSAVLLPSKPAGKSSKDGASDKELKKKQEKLSGIRALAVVFRQYEFDPRKKLLIAAHTDTSGQVEPNFILSEKRAQSVLYILNGERDKWADVCYGQQRVEDYQQIMKYFAKDRGWKCNPGKIDNKCGKNTNKAAENFFSEYRKLHIDPKTGDAFPEDLPLNLVDQVKADPRKRWPVVAWKAVYDLYADEICQVLKIDHKRLKKMYDKRIKKRLIDKDKPYVACGESFPLQNPEKSNYRSQRNRRVEILFFNEKEAIDKIDCPDHVDKKHTAAECPLWYDQLMDITYIDPDYLTADAFHFKFAYYDRIIKEFKGVPDGLEIKVYKKGGAKPFKTGHDYADGIYTVRVLDLKKKDEIRFEFNTYKSPDKKKRQWVYTKTKDDPPEMVIKKDEDIAKMGYKERMHYYDLPPEWSSRNYFTRHDGKENTGDKFETILANYKPFGGKNTTPDKPLVISLEDIILIDDKGSQNINNNTGNKPQDFDKDGNKIDLSDKSRLTLLYLDEEDDYNIKIYKGRTTHPYFSDIEFKKNLITTRIPEKGKSYVPRAILFCSSFYDITDKRTSKGPKFKFSEGHILGARAAVLNDKTVHNWAALSVKIADGTVPANMKDYVQYKCGNYEAHYLHNCGFIKGNLETDKEKPLSYLIIYWNCRMEAHSTEAPTDANWRSKWEKDGMINSMNRTNRPYLIEKKSGTVDILIRMYHFYEAKLDDAGGKHKCIVRMCHTDEDWMLPDNAKFCQASYQGRTDYYGGAGTDAKTKDIDGSTYAPMAHHHEMGHATGLFDDYMYNADLRKQAHPWTTYKTFFGVPGFEHPFTAPGGPYSIDFISTMSECRNPRMRDFWHFVNWINDESGDAGNKKLKPFLNKTTFKMSYKYRKGGSDKVIELDLWDGKYRNPNKACHESSNFVFKTGNNNGKADLLLYHLGGGETACTIDPKHKDNRNHVMNPRHVFDAILVIRHKVALKFIDDTGNWTVNSYENWMKRWVQKPLVDLNKYYFECSRDNENKKILMIFVPHLEVYDAPKPTPTDWTVALPADAHFNIVVKENGGNSFATSGRTINVDDNVDKKKILKYMVGKSSAGNVGKADFNGVGSWLKSELLSATAGGGWYTIKDLPA